jgi:hypothetical protein
VPQEHNKKSAEIYKLTEEQEQQIDQDNNKDHKGQLLSKHLQQDQLKQPLQLDQVFLLLPQDQDQREKFKKYRKYFFIKNLLTI